MPAIIGHNLQHRGEWSGATQYYEDNIVSLNGSSYICILTNLNQSPPNATYWQLVAEKGDAGANGTNGTNGTNGSNGAPGVVQSIVAGTNITVDATDPANPIVSAPGGGGGIGGVSGPTDNALIRADGVGGSTIQGNGGLATLSDAGELVIAKGTLTGSKPHVLSETWNAGGVAFEGLNIAITNSASAAGSRIVKITVGGTVVAAVSVSQLISAIGSVVAGNGPGLTFEGFLDTGIGVNGDNLAFWESGNIVLNLTALNKEFRIPSDFKYAWSSATNNNSSADTILRRISAGVLALGLDASTPVNQKVKASDGSGTDRPGANLTIGAGQPTGAGTAGQIIFQVATTGASGSTLRSLADRVIIDSVNEAMKIMAAAAAVRGLVIKLAAAASANAVEIRDSSEAVLSSIAANGEISAPAITVGNTGLHVLDTDASHDLIVKPGSNLTADRTLTVTTGDANRTVNVIGDGVVGETRSINLTIDGGGSAIATGLKGFIRIPFACTITGWSVLADQSGSIVIDVWKDTYANFPPDVADTIAGSEKPTLSAAVKNEDTSLTTWTTSVAAGDVIAFNVDSASTVTRINLALNVRLT